MSESSDIDDIRQKKLEELRASIEGTDAQPTDAPSTPSEPVTLHGEAELDEFVRTHDVAIVDFFATWCGPCKMMDPVMDDLAADERIAIGEVDIDQNQMLAQQRGVQGVPTFFIYANGEPVERIVGARDKSAFLSVVEQHA